MNELIDQHATDENGSLQFDSNGNHLMKLNDDIDSKLYNLVIAAQTDSAGHDDYRMDLNPNLTDDCEPTILEYAGTSVQHDETITHRPCELEYHSDAPSTPTETPHSISTQSTALDNNYASTSSTTNVQKSQRRRSSGPRGSLGSFRERHGKRSRVIIRKFLNLDEISNSPSPNVMVGQRCAYKEYYGNEFGTIRWIGRVPQISPDWTVGVEFDNAIGEGDGSLNGRRYFIAKDCFAKFLALSSVTLVEQHVGRPEPGTMISVMSAAVRPGQMISIQRVSTVHVQHCFLNAPHQRAEADLLAVNTRLHCQCPNCGPCAHVIKPPRTQRLAGATKNATHMCQFSTYTCCGMESQEETLCTYTGNKISSLPPPDISSMGLPPIGNSWIEGSGYLTNLQEQQTKRMPDEYRFGAAPDDITDPEARRRFHRLSSKRRRRLEEAKQQSARPSITDIPPPTYDDVNRSTRPDQVAISACHPGTRPEDFTPPYSPCLVAGPNTYNVQDTELDHEGRALSDDCSKSPKYHHRESIENRYLFPTDDGIDSTLEADLEDLSQARYGNFSNRRRRPQGPRRFLKSIRSFISCLNTRSEFSARGSNRSLAEQYYSENNHDLNTKAHPIRASTSEDSSYSTIPTNNNNQKLKVQNASQKCTTTSSKYCTSSSDCGFSSSNSINNGPYRSPSVGACNHDIRTREIYQRIVGKLMSLTANENDDENLLKLKQSLSDRRENHCCLQEFLSRASSASFDQAGCEKVIADILQKYLVSQEFKQCLMSCCEQLSSRCPTSHEKSHEPPVGSNFEARGLARTGGSATDATSTSSMSSGVRALSDTSNSNRRSSIVCKEHEDATISKEQSIAMAKLPKAFELKLTPQSESDESKKR